MGEENLARQAELALDRQGDRDSLFFEGQWHSSGSLADRYSPHNRQPGTNSGLRLPGAELIKAGVRAGDLLVATEGSARTIVVRCAGSCTVRYIAAGLATSHAEGHIVFTALSRPLRRG